MKIERRWFLACLQASTGLSHSRRDRWAWRWASIRSPAEYADAGARFMREALEAWGRRARGEELFGDETELVWAFSVYLEKVGEQSRRDPELRDELAKAVKAGLARTTADGPQRPKTPR